MSPSLGKNERKALITKLEHQFETIGLKCERVYRANILE
jgi:hypothetical protein